MWCLTATMHTDHACNLSHVYACTARSAMESCTWDAPIYQAC